jgi:hypothetical protein
LIFCGRGSILAWSCGWDCWYLVSLIAHDMSFGTIWHVAVEERSGWDEEGRSCVIGTAIDTCQINGKIVAIVTCRVTRLL